MSADIQIDCHGSIYLLRGASQAGKVWIEAHVEQGEETQYFAGAIVVEHRYITDIIIGARADGLSVSTNFPTN